MENSFSLQPNCRLKDLCYMIHTVNSEIPLAVYYFNLWKRERKILNRPLPPLQRNEFLIRFLLSDSIFFRHINTLREVVKEILTSLKWNVLLPTCSREIKKKTWEVCVIKLTATNIEKTWNTCERWVRTTEGNGWSAFAVRNYKIAVDVCNW